MDFQQYRRADGLLYLVASDGQVYELRAIELTASALPRAANDGYLTRLADLHVPDLSATQPEPVRRPRRRWRGSCALRVVP
jgi:hypothetical protein